MTLLQRLSRRHTTAAAAAIAAIAASAVAAPPAPAAALPTDSTALLSGQPSMFDPFAAPVGEAWIATNAVSENGRYVAFSSTSDGLLAGDDDSKLNVYRKDMLTGDVVLVSRRDGANGEPSHGFCSDAAISDDGQRVAFVCDVPLDDADKNGRTDVYVRTPAAGATTLVSRVGASGAAGNGSSSEPALSQNGDYVAFESSASDLVGGIPNQSPRVYRRHLPTGQTTLVGRKNGADGAPVHSLEPSISDDGSVVAFTSGEAIDATVDNNNSLDVYMRDVSAATTSLVSRANGAAGAVGNNQSYATAISGNGLGVAFTSSASNLDPRDTGNESNVYLRTGGQFTSVVDVTAIGVKSGEGATPSIDDSGHLIAFASTATALDPADTDPSTDVYVKNIADKSVRVASRASGPGGAAANRDSYDAAISGDGLKVASGLGLGGITADADGRRHTVILHDRSTQITRSVARPPGSAPFVNQGGHSNAASLSADGRFAAFTSDAPALGLPAGPRDGVFVRDRVTGSVVLASRADGAGGAPFADVSRRPAISADGRRVAFSAALNPGDAIRHVWVRDLVAHRTFLASRADGAAGVPGDGTSRGAQLDADGTRVVFRSQAGNLGDGDTDAVEDIHLRDLASGDTILVSRADGVTGAKGDRGSSGPDIDASGTRVAFISDATNLGDGGTDNYRDAFLRDLRAGTTRLVNTDPKGTKGNADVFAAPSIDAAGNRVTFASSATNLADPTTESKVFVRDLGANTLTVAAKGAESVISPDGRYLAFRDDRERVLRHDLSTLKTELVSRRDGADGAAAPGVASLGDISTGGACVTFDSADSLAGPRHDSWESYVRAFNANCGDVPPAGGGGAGGDAGGSPRDTVAPVLSDARLSHRRFRVARAPTAVAAAMPRGTVLRFRASEAGVMRIAIHRVRPGRRPRLRAAGALTRRIAAGSGRIRLTGRIGRRALRPRRYRLRLTAVDAAGNRSTARTLRFRIVA